MAPPIDLMEPQGILPEPLMLIEAVVMAPVATRATELVPVMEPDQARIGLLEPDQASVQAGLLQGLSVHLAEAQVQAVEVLVLHHDRLHHEVVVHDQAVEVLQVKALRAGKTK